MNVEDKLKVISFDIENNYCKDAAISALVEKFNSFFKLNCSIIPSENVDSPNYFQFEHLTYFNAVFPYLFKDRYDRFGIVFNNYDYTVAIYKASIDPEDLTVKCTFRFGDDIKVIEIKDFNEALNVLPIIDEYEQILSGQAKDIYLLQL